MTTATTVQTQDSFWSKSNITLDAVRHGNRTAGYRITHLASGKVYVGWLGDLYRGLTLMAGRLRNGNFPNGLLQGLVLQDSACELEVFIPDHRLPSAEQLDTLRGVMDSWIEAAGANYIFNQAPLPPRQRRPGESIHPLTTANRPRKTRGPLSMPRADSKVPWRNTHVSKRHHCNEGAFKLLHPHSGKTFVGSTLNLFAALSTLSVRLRAQDCTFEPLQKAFNQEARFELTFVQIEQSLPDEERKLKAVELAETWLKELGENGILFQRLRGSIGQGLHASPDRPAKPTKVREPRAASSRSLAPWRNLAMSPLNDCVLGVFELHHPKSDTTFLGATKNLYEALSVLSMKLRTKICTNERMQNAFNDDPVFTLKLEKIADPKVPQSERLTQALRRVEELAGELGDKAEVVLRGRARTATAAATSERQNAINGGRTSPGDGQMYQFTFKAQDGAALPPRDFLHEAWFHYQRPERGQGDAHGQ